MIVYLYVFCNEPIPDFGFQASRKDYLLEMPRLLCGYIVSITSIPLS
jgi:hypothetical protein